MKNLKEFKSFKLTPYISLHGVTENMLTFNGYVFENKLTNLYSKFNLNEVKRLLKEKLDIDENTSKLDIAKKIVKFYYNLNLKILKYELGAILGSFIFYLLSAILDISGVEPFVTNSDQEPGIPHYILWAAGAILGIYKTYKSNL